MGKCKTSSENAYDQCNKSQTYHRVADIRYFTNWRSFWTIAAIAIYTSNICLIVGITENLHWESDTGICHR